MRSCCSNLIHTIFSLPCYYLMIKQGVNMSIHVWLQMFSFWSMKRTKDAADGRRREKRARERGEKEPQKVSRLRAMRTHAHISREAYGERRRRRRKRKESVDPINQSLMVSDMFLFVRLDEPLHKRRHTIEWHQIWILEEKKMKLFLFMFLFTSSSSSLRVVPRRF